MRLPAEFAESHVTNNRLPNCSTTASWCSSFSASDDFPATREFNQTGIKDRAGKRLSTGAIRCAYPSPRYQERPPELHDSKSQVTTMNPVHAVGHKKSEVMLLARKIRSRSCALYCRTKTRGPGMSTCFEIMNCSKDHLPACGSLAVSIEKKAKRR